MLVVMKIHFGYLAVRGTTPMHDVGHRCVTRDKGGCERGDILRKETVRVKCSGQICGGGRDPASECFHFGALLRSPICHPVLDC